MEPTRIVCRTKDTAQQVVTILRYAGEGQMTCSLRSPNDETTWRIQNIWNRSKSLQCVPLKFVEGERFTGWIATLNLAPGLDVLMDAVRSVMVNLDNCGAWAWEFVFGEQTFSMTIDRPSDKLVIPWKGAEETFQAFKAEMLRLGIADDVRLESKETPTVIACLLPRFTKHWWLTIEEVATIVARHL